MKKLFLSLIIVMALAGCTSIPVDVYFLREGMTVETVYAIASKPDRIIHTKTDGHSYEQWFYRDAKINLKFEDNKLIEWSN